MKRVLVPLSMLALALFIGFCCNSIYQSVITKGEDARILKASTECVVRIGEADSRVEALISEARNYTGENKLDSDAYRAWQGNWNFLQTRMADVRHIMAIEDIYYPLLIIPYMKYGKNLAEFKRTADDFEAHEKKLKEILAVK